MRLVDLDILRTESDLDLHPCTLYGAPFVLTQFRHFCKKRKGMFDLELNQALTDLLDRNEPKQGSPRAVREFTAWIDRETRYQIRLKAYWHTFDGARERMAAMTTAAMAEYMVRMSK
jgi:hypothetical protein